MQTLRTLATLADDLACGRTSARKLVENVSPGSRTRGRGVRAFIHVDAEAAIEAAEAMDRLREVKAAPSAIRRHSRFDQGPVRHQRAGDPRGSRALDDSAPAEADAPRWRGYAAPASS